MLGATPRVADSAREGSPAPASPRRRAHDKKTQSLAVRKKTTMLTRTSALRGAVRSVLLAKTSTAALGCTIMFATAPAWTQSATPEAAKPSTEPMTEIVV